VSAETDFVERVDPFRRELLAHCYRMLGSVHDAEDLVQETYLRAWRGYPDFQGRSSVRTWLYRIATNVCLNALAGRERRVLPSGLGGPSAQVPDAIGERLLEVAWLQPIPDALLGDDPASVLARRESTRLAFVAALQHLSARQRAALLLRDVAGFSAAEAGSLLGLSTAATTSALQRARGHIAEHAPDEDDVTEQLADHALVDRFVAAIEHADFDALARMLRADVELEMPPVPMWFAGRAVPEFFARYVLPVRRRIITTSANSGPALASYRVEGDGRFHAHHLLLFELRGGKIARMSAFLDEPLFETFAMPLILD
jgi:RNA polymerase sigma-70 factor (ECF subfamily)